MEISLEKNYTNVKHILTDEICAEKGAEFLILLGLASGKTEENPTNPN